MFDLVPQGIYQGDKHIIIAFPEDMLSKIFVHVAFNISALFSQKCLQPSPNILNPLCVDIVIIWIEEISGVVDTFVGISKLLQPIITFPEIGHNFRSGFNMPNHQIAQNGKRAFRDTLQENGLIFPAYPTHKPLRTGTTDPADVVLSTSDDSFVDFQPPSCTVTATHKAPKRSLVVGKYGPGPDATGPAAFVVGTYIPVAVDAFVGSQHHFLWTSRAQLNRLLKSPLLHPVDRLLTVLKNIRKHISIVSHFQLPLCALKNMHKWRQILCMCAVYRWGYKPGLRYG